MNLIKAIKPWSRSPQTIKKVRTQNAPWTDLVLVSDQFFFGSFKWKMYENKESMAHSSLPIVKQQEGNLNSIRKLQSIMTYEHT
jgi:hypothetical protein